MQRRYDTRLIKTKWSYTVKAIAKLFAIDRNTVRGWVKDGLEPIDENKPIVIHGSVLKEWLDARQAKRKKPCKAGEIYCPKCRVPKRLKLGSFYIEPTNTLKLTAKAQCQDCPTTLTRFDVTANRSKIIALFGYAAKEAAK